jgi:hypothetical protein
MSMCPPNKQTAPVIIAWTDARLEYVHATVHLICRAIGNPTPKIEWYRLDSDEQRLPLKNEFVCDYRLSQPFLHISDA